MARKKRENKKLRNEFFLTSLAMIAVGIMLVFFPETSGKMICYLSGCVLLAWGVIKLIMYFVGEVELFGSFRLVSSVALLMCGAAALINPEFFAGILPTIFGCVMVIDGVLKLQYSIDLAKIKSKWWWIVLILSLLLVSMGLLIVFNPWSWLVGLMIFTGILLIVNGVIDIIVVLYIESAIKHYNANDKTVYLDESQYKDED